MRALRDSAPATPLVQRMLASTSKGSCAPAVLMLEDGTVFYGRSCGAAGTVTGEVCFNTSLEGYFEVLTDPSYAGQIITMTYPQIGNYGIDLDDAQLSCASGEAVVPGAAAPDAAPAPAAADPGRAARPAPRAMVVRDMCRTPSNWRSTISVPAYLQQRGIVAIEGVDTRALVRHLRDNGAQKGIVSTETLDVDQLRAQLAAAPDLVGQNLVQTVSCKHAYTFGIPNLVPSRAFACADAPAPRHRVVAYDCGIKRGILEGLVHAGCELTVVPWDTPAEEVLAQAPDGVFLSNGPGDPDAVAGTYTQVEKLLGTVPVFGICLGHQMISLACGGTIEKLKYGHRGGNQPVMNLVSGRVEITAQNHGFGLVWESLGELVPELSGGIAQHPAHGDLRFWARAGVAPVVRNKRFGLIRLTHVNLNDGTAEGIQLMDARAFSVQYHPEAAPGPTDARYLFAAFVHLMDGDANYLDIDIAANRLAGWKFSSACSSASKKEAAHA